MSQVYASPPIEEVVCEFRLPESFEWDAAIPGMLFERLREYYPQREPRLFQEFRTQTEAEKRQHRLRMGRGTVFADADEKNLLQVRPHVLSVNRLAPYPGWQEFRPQIARVYSAFQELAEVQKLQRAGLRYINRIETAMNSRRLQKFFQFRPHIGTDLPQEFQNFILGAEFAFDANSGTCRVQLRPTANTEPEMTAVLLDLDYFAERLGDTSPETIMEWIDSAREHVGTLFEACITDELRERFEQQSSG